jgi:hypothetical protein
VEILTEQNTYHKTEGKAGEKTEDERENTSRGG